MKKLRKLIRACKLIHSEYVIDVHLLDVFYCEMCKLFHDNSKSYGGGKCKKCIFNKDTDYECTRMHTYGDRHLRIKFYEILIKYLVNLEGTYKDNKDRIKLEVIRIDERIFNEPTVDVHTLTFPLKYRKT